MTLPRNLPDLLRAAGLTVVEVDGWQTRGRPASTGGFEPVGVLNHHTGASAKGWSLAKELTYAKWMFLTGRPDLPAPLCQMALGRSGTIYLGAAGRANHAGTAKSSGSVGSGDGNRIYAGIEWMLSGTEEIPADMKMAGLLLNAVLTEKVTQTSTETISCHYNTSVTGKWDIGDPNGVQYGDKRVLDIKAFRLGVKAERERLYHQEPAPQQPAPQQPAPQQSVPGQNTEGTAYRWFQLGQVGSSTSGCALGVRRGFGALRDTKGSVGSEATDEGSKVTGHGIRERVILRGTVKAPAPRGQMVFGAAAGHAPPKRAPKARAAFMSAFAQTAAQFKGGDLNVRERLAQRLLGRRVVGDGVLWLTVPRRGWKVVSVKAVDVGGDHKAVLARVQNERTGVIVRFLVINCMSVSTGPKQAAQILANGLALKPDVVMASECADFRAVAVDR